LCLSNCMKCFFVVCFCCNGRWLKLCHYVTPDSLLSLVIYTSTILVYFTWLNKIYQGSLCVSNCIRPIMFLVVCFCCNGRWLKLWHYVTLICMWCVVSCYMYLMNLCNNNLSYLIYRSYLCDMKYIWSILYSCDTIVWTALLIILCYCFYLYKNLYKYTIFI
jgi:hypothetical protein